MELIRRMFGSRSLDSYVRQARTKLATCEFEQALRVVAEGYGAFPDAQPLREVELTIRQAQARAGIRSLKAQVDQTDNPRAHEALIALYLELGMAAEVRKATLAYVSAHPERDTPHLLLGEIALQDFLDALQSRDAHVALMHLQRAAILNSQAIKPRLLLAELYYVVGADKALKEMEAEIAPFAQADPHIAPVMEQIRSVPEPSKTLTIDGLFERVEADGTLKREPRTWLRAFRRPGLSRVDPDRAREAADSLMKQGVALELVLMQRNGDLLAHVSQSDLDEAEDAREEGAEATAEPDEDENRGLVNVVRAVSRTVSRYARDLDLGQFKRCTMQGNFGLVTVGEVCGVVTGARWPRNPEPQRLWERVTVGLEGELGGGRR